MEGGESPPKAQKRAAQEPKHGPEGSHGRHQQRRRGNGGMRKLRGASRGEGGGQGRRST